MELERRLERYEDVARRENVVVGNAVARVAAPVLLAVGEIVASNEQLVRAHVNRRARGNVDRGGKHVARVAVVLEKRAARVARLDGERQRPRRVECGALERDEFRRQQWLDVAI